MYRVWDDKDAAQLLLDQVTIQRELLDSIRQELKILNLYMAHMTGEELTDAELEEEHY